MPVYRLIATRKATARGMSETPRMDRPHQLVDDEKSASNKTSPEGRIPAGGPIPQHRDTTISVMRHKNMNNFVVS